MSKIYDPEAQFFGHFGPSNESKFGFLTILLESFLSIRTSLALYAHWSYFQRCVQYGPIVSQNSGLWSLSQWFHISTRTRTRTILFHSKNIEQCNTTTSNDIVINFFSHKTDRRPF